MVLVIEKYRKVCHLADKGAAVAISQALFNRFYGGANYDGTRLFYAWIRQHTRPDMRLLNLGAGPPTESPVRTFKGEVAEVVGADVDRCVLTNTELDRAVLIENGRVPLADASFDVVVSDYVLEHVEFPEAFVAEVHRLLKPGGNFYFRTPNIYHYVALISRLTPHGFHKAAANRARGNAADAQEPWPTFYRLNSRRALVAAARKAGFSHWDLRMIEMDPSYLRFSTLPFLAGVTYERLVNSTAVLAGVRANVFGCLTK